MAEALRLAILGAECTGKSELTQSLRERLALQTGLRVAAVGEWLREWCDIHQRTPLQHEQAAIAEEQQRRIEAACAGHDIVVSDTTALMTAVYSLWYFNDPSLVDSAIAAHASIDLVLLTALDLPWQADGHQRDGEHVREPVDDLLRGLLIAQGLPFSVVHGTLNSRSEAAWQATLPVLQRRGLVVKVPAEGANARSGLFSGLLDTLASPARRSHRGAWVCECCVPEAEQASLRLLKASRGA
jgi:nicotinamide riboside kinase